MLRHAVVRIGGAVLLGAVGFGVSTLFDGPVRRLLVITAFTVLGWIAAKSIDRVRVATATLVGAVTGTVVGIGIGALWIVIEERIGEPIPEGAEGPTYLVIVLGLFGLIAGALISGWWAVRRRGVGTGADRLREAARLEVPTESPD